MTVSAKDIRARVFSYRPKNEPTKVSDLIADYLTAIGSEHIFVVQGGCAVHMIDSASRHSRLKPVPVQHEQSGAMAADAVSRLTSGIGVAIATSGPGATNLLTGVCCSFYDSVPTLLLTGQVPASQMKGDSGSRQVGFQETDVVSIFQPITKCAKLVSDPYEILFALDEAILTAVEGRMGPVLLDICDDVQRAIVTPAQLDRFQVAPETATKSELKLQEESSSGLLRQIQHHWDSAERPIVILGAGALTDRPAAIAFLRKTDVPFLCTWATVDAFAQMPNCVGTFGTTSSRIGNFAVQNADFVIAIGTRLDTHEIGNRAHQFAPLATRVMVDLDASEIRKFESVSPEFLLGLTMPSQDFLEWAQRGGLAKMGALSQWRSFLGWLSDTFPACTDSDRMQVERVNPYFFMERLGEYLPADSIVIPDCGSNLIWTMQGLKLRHESQRLFSAWNHSPMGYALPASIGAQFGFPNSCVVCITGDGGLQMNIQELATITRYQLPTIIFVMNNHGHGIIQGTQDQWLDSRHFASDYEGGLPDPDYSAIGQAYGLETLSIDTHQDVDSGLQSLFSSRRPCLCVVDMLPQAQIYPKLVAGAQLHELSPPVEPELFAAATRFLRQA